jgi:hypothetical protein
MNVSLYFFCFVLCDIRLRLSMKYRTGTRCTWAQALGLTVSFARRKQMGDGDSVGLMGTFNEKKTWKSSFMCGRHDEFQDTELQDVNCVRLTKGTYQ